MFLKAEPEGIHSNIHALMYVHTQNCKASYNIEGHNFDFVCHIYKIGFITEFVLSCAYLMKTR